MALRYLRHILFDMLPSPDMKAQGQLLSISNHLEMMHDSLWAINAVIVDGELQDFYMQLLKEKRPELEKKPELEEWVKEVDLAIVDVEDLLSRILQWKPGIAEASDCSSHSFLDDLDRVFFRRSILTELEETVHKLNYLGRRGSALGLHREMLDSMHPLQEEYSDILGDEVVGRDKEKDDLINFLKQQQQQPINNGDCTTSIIVIEGAEKIFSVQKTTLARMIYHDPWVRENFKYRIWVDAYHHSDPDSRGIAEEIVRSIRREESPQTENANWSTVKDLFGKNKYLLILDHYDNFPDFINQWVALKNTLLHLGGLGSAVIITMAYDTQYDDQSNMNRYMLRGISKDAWKELLVKQAVIHPTDTEEDQHHASAILTPNDEDDESLLNPTTHARIAGAIVRCTKMNRWNDTDTVSPDFSLKHQLLELPSLFHGYDHTLRTLASVCSSLFPINSRPYYYEEMWYMWEAEGLLPSGSYFVKHAWQVEEVLNSRIERKQWSFRLRMGEDARIPQGCLYLCLLSGSHASRLLFRRSLLAGINKKLRALFLLHEEGQKQDDIVLEDQIHEIAIGIFKKLKCLRILYIRGIRIKQIPNALGRLRSLRYLKLFEMEITTLPKSLCNLHNLKILYLDHCEELQKLPEHIGKLVSLRILKLEYCTKLQKLPKSISRLASLEELSVAGCLWLIELPEGLENIMRLRKLDMSECASLIRMPLNIRQMTQLEVLNGLLAAYNDDGGLGIRCTILELQELTNLRVLYLRNLERVSKLVEDIQMIKLQDKGRLEYLSLHWECCNIDEDIANAESLQLIEALKPNPNHLSFLRIISYPGKDFPSWMKVRGGVPTTYNLNYLIHIKLINLKGCERLPPLGHLPILQRIEISGMDLISVIDDSFYGDNGIFPSLKSIIFSEMPLLEGWQEVERESHVLPRLEKLTLIQCPRFKGFHPHTSISYLSVWLNNETLLTCNYALWHNFSSIEQLEIIGCHELRCFPQAMKNLKKLRILVIVSCNKLEALPDWLLRFKYLKLYISNCARLSFIPERLKSRLSIIEGCPKLRL